MEMASLESQRVRTCSYHLWWMYSPKAFLPTHATAAIQGFIQRLTQNTGYCANLSSARTANILINTPYKPDDINLKTSGTATEDYQ
ncbi:hypothetical protein ACF3VQ_12415 [Yersinia sp. HM-2024]|uniref:hypothetical protein n=1 Tax=Yersinia sp. HM-2024 TaxID=3344550 RepID=UPI00370D7264